VQITLSRTQAMALLLFQWLLGDMRAV